MKRITPPSKEELKTLYPENSLNDIAKMKGVSVTTVCNWCHFYKLPMRSRGSVDGSFKRPDIDTGAILTLKAQGLKPGQIATALNTSRALVAYRLESYSDWKPDKDFHDKSQSLPWDEIIRKYSEPLKTSAEKLAEEFGVSSGVIIRGLEERNIEIRSKTAHMVDLWAKRKALMAKGAAAEQKRMTSETKNRITARAYFRILGKSQWDLAKDGDLYPRQNLTDIAYKSIYTFDREYEPQIQAEVTRLLQLNAAEQRAAGMTARSKLRT